MALVTCETVFPTCDVICSVSCPKIEFLSIKLVSFFCGMSTGATISQSSSPKTTKYEHKQWNIVKMIKGNANQVHSHVLSL